MNCKQVATWRVFEVKRGKQNQAKSRKIFLTFKGMEGTCDTRLQVVFLQVHLWQFLCKLVEQNCGRAAEGPNYWYCRYDIQPTCRSRAFASHPQIYLQVRLVRRALDLLYILVSSRRQPVCAVHDQFQYEMKHSGRRRSLL